MPRPLWALPSSSTPSLVSQKFACRYRSASSHGYHRRSGAATGMITGATGVFVISAVPYLQALGLEKAHLVQALGLSFTASTVALAAGLASHGALHFTASGISVLCLAPALVGMLLGQWIRVKVDPGTFRLLFFVGLLLLGGDLIVRSMV